MPPPHAETVRVADGVHQPIERVGVSANGPIPVPKGLVSIIALNSLSSEFGKRHEHQLEPLDC